MIGGISKRRKPETESSRSPFGLLSQELILEVALHRSLSGELSLTYTCRQLRNTMAFRIDDTLIELKCILIL